MFRQGGTPTPVPPGLSWKALAGQALFFDTRLSASGEHCDGYDPSHPAAYDVPTRCRPARTEAAGPL
jgi:hypothetical protein